MKNLLRLIVLISLFSFGIAVKSQAQTVYVTENGKKYHAKNCDLAKTGKKGLTLEEAKKKGFTPCKNCKAEAIVNEPKKAQAGKPKKK